MPGTTAPNARRPLAFDPNLTDADEASLRSRGFVPFAAQDLVPGDEVIVYSADLLGDGVAGTGRTLRVRTVTRVSYDWATGRDAPDPDGCEIAVAHSEGQTVADECSAVWVVR